MVGVSTSQKKLTTNFRIFISAQGKLNEFYKRTCIAQCHVLKSRSLQNTVLPEIFTRRNFSPISPPVLSSAKILSISLSLSHTHRHTYILHRSPAKIESKDGASDQILSHHVFKHGRDVVHRYRRPSHTQDTIKLGGNERNTRLLGGFSKQHILHNQTSNL